MSIGVDALLAHRNDIDAELQKHKSPITVMFTDLAGSTSFFEKFGDTVGVAWLEEHNQIVIPKLAANDGVLVKTIGDSVMAYFTDSKKAILASMAMQKALLEANRKRSDGEQMFVRVALHHGLGYLRGGDVFGDVVNVAARIAKSCLPGQILVSEAVYVSTGTETDIKFESQGAVQFAGKTSKEALYEVQWTDADTYQQIRQKFPPKKQATQEDFTGGRYIMMNELGRGAMGVVYKAYDRLIGRAVALKTIPLEVPESERAALIDRLKAEARTAGILDHPNIVTVFDVGEEAGLFYFTMQLVDGRTLAEVKESRELLPLDKLFGYADEVCAAMAFAHKAGVIHRDLKPSNLMITSAGNMKVMDFGIAKLGDSGLTKAGMVLGTPSYLAPEQAAGRRIDNRADIFSLGAVLYEMFTGEKAFAGEITTAIIYKVLNDDPIPPRAIEPSLPPRLDAVIKKALAKDPMQRYQSCDDLREDLRLARGGMASQAAAVGSGTAYAARTQAQPAAIETTQPIAVAKQSSSSGMGMWLGAAVALVVVGAGGYFAWQNMQKKDPATPQAEASAPASTASTPASPPARPQTAAVKHSEVAQPSTQPDAPSTIREKAIARGLQRLEARKEARNEKLAAGTVAAPPAAEAAPGGMWSASDIPNLLSKADGYAGRGEYQKAIFLYEQILRIDPQNAQARTGAARAREARNLRR
ncbi:MAG TPA: protein kinase [Terriglobales bacterium]|nr:protein kinase [Terriglobales bacterium]